MGFLFLVGHSRAASFLRLLPPPHTQLTHTHTTCPHKTYYFHTTCSHTTSSHTTRNWDPGDPLLQNIMYIYNMSRPRRLTSIQMVHTHTHPAFGRVVSRHMRSKWGWKGEWGWDESENEMKDYLTGTRGGERKRRGKKQTHTNTPGPERANP